MSDFYLYCPNCTERRTENRQMCQQCGYSLAIERSRAAQGVAYVLGEIQHGGLADALAADERERLTARYESELSRVAASKPATRRVPRAEVAVAEAPATPASALPPLPERRRTERNKQPAQEWAWLAEQQANLFLFAGAFLTVIAALIYVGYSGESVTGPLKMALLIIYTGAFIGAALLCLKHERVRAAGHVFLAVGSLLVPLNFVAARAFYSGDTLDGETLWLLGSLACLGLYSAIALTGIARQYAYSAAVAAASATMASAARADVDVEWVPAFFGALSLLLLAPYTVGNSTIRDRLALPWIHVAFIVAAVALAACGLAGEDASRWPLLVTTVLVTLHASSVAVLLRSRLAAAVAVIGAELLPVTLAYALDAPAEAYVLALMAAAFASLAVCVASSRRWPAVIHSEAMLFVRITALGAAAVAVYVGAALLLADETGSRTAEQPWMLLAASLLAVAGASLDVGAWRGREGVVLLACSLVLLCITVVYVAVISFEYYAFAALGPAVAFTLLRLEGERQWQRTFGSVPASDISLIAGVLASTGAAAAVVAALAAESSDITWQPQTHAFLLVAMALTSVLAGLISWKERDGFSPTLMLSALIATALSLAYVADAEPSMYGLALAGAAVGIALAGRAARLAWIPMDHINLITIPAVTVAWIVFAPAYAESPRIQAFASVAAATCYFALSLGRSERTSGTVAPGVGLRALWLYPGCAALATGYVSLLGQNEDGLRAEQLAMPFAVIAGILVLAGLISGSRRPDFAVHFHLMALAAAVGSLLVGPEPGVMALLLPAYAATSIVVALRHNEPAYLAPGIAFAAVAVPVLRDALDAPWAALPAGYSALGIGALAAAASARDEGSWRRTWSSASAGYALAAPAVGLLTLAWLDGQAPHTTSLFESSAASAFIAAGLISALAVLHRRNEFHLAASAVALAGVLLVIGRFDPPNPQAYTATVGAYLVLLGMVGLRRLRLAPSYVAASDWVEAFGAAIIMLPSLAQSLDGGWRYELLLGGESLAFLAIATSLRRRRLAAVAVGAMVLAAGRALLDGINAMPNWLVAMSAGLTLLGIGVAILNGRERWELLQKRMSAWWQLDDQVADAREG